MASSSRSFAAWARSGRRLAAAVGALACVPGAGLASVRVSVEFAYGTAVAGGVGLFVYVAQSWEVGLAALELPTCLLDVGAGRVRWGVPAPLALPEADPAGELEPGYRFDLLRWHF